MQKSKQNECFGEGDLIPLSSRPSRLPAVSLRTLQQKALSQICFAVTHGCTMPSSNPSQLYALGVLPFNSGGRKTVTRPSITQAREKTLSNVTFCSVRRHAGARMSCAACPDNLLASNLGRWRFPVKLVTHLGFDIQILK